MTTIRVMILKGKYVQGVLETNPPYIEVRVQTEPGHLATVTAFDTANASCKYLAIACKKSCQPFFRCDTSVKLSEQTPLVRLSKEDIAAIDAEFTTMVFRFIDGYVEKHTFRNPKNGRHDRITVVGVVIDDTHMQQPLTFNDEKVATNEMAVEMSNTEMYSWHEDRPTSYYETIQKVEQRNGAFPCVIH